MGGTDAWNSARTGPPSRRSTAGSLAAAARVVLRPPPTPPFRCCCCCCCCSSLLGCIHAHCFDPTVSAAMPAHFPPRQVPVAPGKSRLMSLPLATNKKFR